jgi:hypothetical protein
VIQAPKTGLLLNASAIYNNKKVDKMEQHTLKNVSNCRNTSIYSYRETSGGQSSNLYLNVVHFVNASVN